MRVARIDQMVCDRAEGCPVRRTCPRGAVVPVPGGPRPGAKGYEVRQDWCTGCGVCVRFCPRGAVSLAVPVAGTERAS